MSVSVAVPAILSAIDTMGGGLTATINIDLNQQASQAGLLTLDIPAASIAGGSVSVPAYVDNVDNYGGGALTEMDVDFRHRTSWPNSGGGLARLRVPSSSIVSPAAPAAAPTMGSAVSGALPAATYKAVITYVYANGESAPSAESSEAVAANSVPTIASPPAASDVTGYNVYLTNGASGTETKQNTTPIAIGTAYQLPATGLVVGTAEDPVTSLGSGACTVTIATSGAAFSAGVAVTLTVAQ